VLYVCIEYHIHIQINMYHVNAQDVDECMINIHYYLLLFTKVIRMLFGW